MDDWAALPPSPKLSIEQHCEGVYEDAVKGYFWGEMSSSPIKAMKAAKQYAIKNGKEWPIPNRLKAREKWPQWCIPSWYVHYCDPWLCNIMPSARKLKKLWRQMQPGWRG